jgi:hypothetical protein
LALMSWLADNMQWVFSGVGTSALGGGVVLGWRLWKKRRQAKPRQTFLTAEEIARFTNDTPSLPTPRLFVPDTPTQMRAVYDGCTTMQGDAIARDRYLGKWLRIQLPVENVSEEFGSLCVSLLEVGAPRFASISAFFNESWRPHFTHVREGTKIRVVGKIDSISKTNVSLADAELEDAEAGAAVASG